MFIYQMPREKSSAGSLLSEAEFIPAGAMRKTVGLSHNPDKEIK